MTEVYAIGRTNYYSVRKGTTQYRIAEGKRLQDVDYCWQLQKDMQSGKSYFVNGRGVRRWHLPDIYQTQQEREEEERELQFRREQKQKDDQKEGAGAPQEGGDDVELALLDSMAAREKAATALRPLKEWENADEKRKLMRFAKATLTPYVIQGRLDEREYATVVNIATKEYMARMSSLTESQKIGLRNDILALATSRMDVRKLQAEVSRRNEELVERVRRLETEKKTLKETISTMQSASDKMKEELFALRAQKKNLLVESFRRLTQKGLVQTYWERLLQHKEILEAQMHVKAREKRMMKLTDRVKELETELAEQKEVNLKLLERVHKAEGRNIMTLLLRQTGHLVMERFFVLWRRWAIETKKEQQFHQIRMQLASCPNCELRAIDTERLRKRLTDTIATLHQTQNSSLQSEELVGRLEKQLGEAYECVAVTKKSQEDAVAMTAAMSRDAFTHQRIIKEKEDTIHNLHNEIDRLKFEHADFQPKKHNEDGQPTGITKDSGGKKANLSTFFSDEAQISEDKLIHLVVARRGEGNDNSMMPCRGAVSADTAAALAPAVVQARRHTSPPPQRKHEKVLVSASAMRRSVSTDDSLIYNSAVPSSSSEEGSEDRNDDEKGKEKENGDASPSIGIPEASDLQKKKLGEDENQICEHCGFRKKLTPFCPRDGSRHIFLPFSQAYGDAARERELGSGLPAAALGASSYLLAQRMTRTPHHGLTNTLNLPQGKPPLTEELRKSLVLDPKHYKGPKLFNSLHETKVGEPMVDTDHVRQVAECIRETRMATERAYAASAATGNTPPPVVSPLGEFRHPVSVEEAEKEHNANWRAIFDYSDIKRGLYGTIAHEDADALFGVYRGDNAEPQLPSRNFVAEQTSTPSIAPPPTRYRPQ